MVSPSVQKRITTTLFASQSLFSASSILSFTLMPIISAHLGGSDTYVGIPPTVVMLGRAIAAYPVGWLMDRLGRRTGLSIGYVLAALGAILCVLSIQLWASLLGFSIGGLFMGMGRGVIEQARFVAAEVYPPEQQAKAIGWIVLAGTFGAIGGPLLVDPSGHLSASFGLHTYTGPYIFSAVLIAIALLLNIIFLRPDPMTIGQALRSQNNSEESNDGRPLKEIFQDRSVRLGVSAMVIGQLVMTLIMVITPLHMNHHAHGIDAISWVIMAHTVGMYGLSWLTGMLITRFGRVPIVIMGAIILAISAILTPISTQMPLLIFALFLLGLGWNFCFIAGSSLLSESLASIERGRTQGATETGVALAASVGALSTGPIFASAGMVAICAIGLAFSLALFAGTSWWKKQTVLIPAED
ncbi:MAG: MFS family permease [Candidatus Latescibacterota bacterium]|jgi:MFS family permease